MRWIIIILLLIALGAKNEKIEELEAQVALLQWANGECETGEELKDEVIKELIEPKGQLYWIHRYEEWKESKQLVAKEVKK